MTRTFRIGIFDTEDQFISAVRSLNEEGIVIHDVFTPYPVHEIFHMLKRKTRLPTAAYFSGLFGLVATLAFLYYTTVIDWPLVYGGKPFNSFPSFVVITVVLTIFTVTIAGLFFFSARSKLIPGRDNTIFDIRATDDKFVIAVETASPDDPVTEKAEKLMIANGASEVLTKEFEKVTT